MHWLLLHKLFDAPQRHFVKQISRICIFDRVFMAGFAPFLVALLNRLSRCVLDVGYNERGIINVLVTVCTS